MRTLAVVLSEPREISLRSLEIAPPGAGEIAVDVVWSGISAGTERLLWAGRMPPFPGLAYPLVPGYESVGLVTAAGAGAETLLGKTVFMPGASCYGAVRGLFGGAASRAVLPATRALAIDPALGENGVLLALAATAHHAVRDAAPDLVIGHGVLGRLLARVSMALGAPPPMVWESDQSRRVGDTAYPVVAPEDDQRRDYRTICDASGDPDVLDQLIGRLARGGEIVLAGFYAERLSFAFPPAFLREVRLSIRAEWARDDLEAVRDLVARGALDLGGLITHRAKAGAAPAAYRTAFEDRDCLKMILDWREAA